MDMIDRPSQIAGRPTAQLGVIDGWNRFWFTPADPELICWMRIAVGLVLLYVYGTIAPQALDYVGPGGWVDQQAIRELRTPDQGGWALIDRWSQSVWFYTADRQWAWRLYVYLLLAIVCFAAGLFTHISNVLVLVGHLSVIHRALLFSYGVDNVLAMLLLYMLLSPCGARYSVDASLRRYWRRRGDVVSEGPSPSVGANLALRCIQLHLCVIYLCSGLSKLQGKQWWDGTAVWDVVMSNEIHFFDLRPVAYVGDFGVSVLSLIASGFTVAFEVGFPLLIWKRRLRPAFLVAAILLHVGIAVIMGLWSFGMSMIIACSAFVPPEWLRQDRPA